MNSRVLCVCIHFILFTTIQQQHHMSSLFGKKSLLDRSGPFAKFYNIPVLLDISVWHFVLKCICYKIHSNIIYFYIVVIKAK